MARGLAAGGIEPDVPRRAILGMCSEPQREDSERNKKEKRDTGDNRCYRPSIESPSADERREDEEGQIESGGFSQIDSETQNDRAGKQQPNTLRLHAAQIDSQRCRR